MGKEDQENFNVIIKTDFLLFSCSKEIKAGGVNVFDPHDSEKALKGLQDMAKQGDLEKEFAQQVAYTGKDYEKTDGRLKIEGKVLKYIDSGCALVIIETLGLDEEIKKYIPVSTKTTVVCLEEQVLLLMFPFL